MPERFSEYFRVEYDRDTEWFNPLLTEDTHLYVDPFLIFLSDDERWSGGHERIMAFFDIVLQLLSECGFKENTPAFTKAKGLLLFPEPAEFCLGVSEMSVLGRGAGEELQKGMLKGAAVAVKAGIGNLRHFEEIALFGDQIGPDRISDMTCNILKSDFIEYTQEICRSLGVPMQRFAVTNARWDLIHKRWISAMVELPLNRYATDQRGQPVGIILTPKAFLRRIPSVDPMDFWEYAMSVEGDLLRADLNYEIGQQVDRKLIIRLAENHPELLTRYIEGLEESPKPAYNVLVDPDYIVKKYDDAKLISSSFQPGAPPSDLLSLQGFVEKVVENFKQCVENTKGWELLWAGREHRSEREAQILFWVSSKSLCESANVDLTPEAETGRGSVDFKLSQGATWRVLVELKLAKSSTFWQNEKNQLSTYQRAQRCENGYLVVVQFSDKDCSKEFTDGATEVAAKVSRETGRPFQVVFIDARRKLSGSAVKDVK